MEPRHDVRARLASEAFLCGLPVRPLAVVAFVVDVARLAHEVGRLVIQQIDFLPAACHMPLAVVTPARDKDALWRET